MSADSGSTSKRRKILMEEVSLDHNNSAADMSEISIKNKCNKNSEGVFNQKEYAKFSRHRSNKNYADSFASLIIILQIESMIKVKLSFSKASTILCKFFKLIDALDLTVENVRTTQIARSTNEILRLKYGIKSDEYSKLFDLSVAGFLSSELRKVKDENSCISFFNSILKMNEVKFKIRYSM